ncbi:MAG: ATP-dependent DNA helicase [Desulfobacterales bacterium]|nr:ATP-dependent DNA helicase [Desulfobacterales bacterium]MCP4160914.1 ATP-dependent DNA helicase [Deltaproteobacteria bacterium]
MTESKRKLFVSVRTLVKYVSRSGDIESTFMGSNRMVDGIKAHLKIQKSRPNEYTREVTILHEIEQDDFTLVINGRMDGLYEYPDHVIIDEIKSTYKDPSWFEHNENQKHWSQVKVYAYLYASKNSLESINTKVTYYNLVTEEVKEYDKSHTLEELQLFFEDLVKDYIKWQSLVAKWRSVRDKSIENMDFPFETYRNGQRDMAVNVYLAIKNKEQLLCKAPTGIGKTIAAIFPSIKSLKENHITRIFYLTARTTGRTVANKALDILRKKGLKIKYIVLTAKEKICFNKDAACNGQECEYARGYYDKLGDALQELFNHNSFSRERIESLAEKYEICPFEYSLDISYWADILICDYNYAFAPNVYLKRFFDEETKDYAFLIDEAHNLTERARDIFSADLSDYSFQKCIEDLDGEEKKIGRVSKKILSWFSDQTMFQEEGFCYEAVYPDGLNASLRSFLKVADDFLSTNIKTSYRDTILDLYFSISSFMRISETYDSCYVSCYETNDYNKKLKLFCIDPSVQLKEALKRSRSAIFFSATLSPASYFKEVFGMNETAYELSLPSPFPEENLKVILLDSIATTYKKRENSRVELADALCAITNECSGNFLFFFPSYKYMEMIYELYGLKSPDKETLIQSYGMSEYERENFIEKFAEENGSLAGFAVMGGVFGEGIDLIGDQLKGVAITGVGLPGITPEREIIREYFEEKIKMGFDYAYVFPGINRVLQAAGRVIRTDTDKGIVVLIDERFSKYPYRSLLHREWKPIKVRNLENLDNILDGFWN